MLCGTALSAVYGAVADIFELIWHLWLLNEVDVVNRTVNCYWIQEKLITK